jgi:hypothetical protein
MIQINEKMHAIIYYRFNLFLKKYFGDENAGVLRR